MGLALIIPFSASRRPPVAITTVFVLVFLVVMVLFSQTYRDVAREGALTARRAVATVPTFLRQAVADNSVVRVLPNPADYLARRIRDIDSPVIVIQRTPVQVSFRSQLQLIEVPLAGIARLFDDVIDVCTNPQAIFLVLLLSPSLVRGEYNWVTIVSTMPGTIFVWLLAVAITFRARRLA